MALPATLPFAPVPVGDLKWMFDRDPGNFHRRTFEITLWSGDIPVAVPHTVPGGFAVQVRAKGPECFELWCKLPATFLTLADAKAAAEAFFHG